MASRVKSIFSVKLIVVPAALIVLFLIGWIVLSKLFRKEFQIAPTRNYAQFVMQIALDPQGNFVVVWQSNVQNGRGWDIFARLYNADGTARSDEFQINTITDNDQFVPRVAMDSTGKFTIVWESQGLDENSYDIYCRRYSAEGIPLGEQFRVNSTVLNSQHDPTIAMTPDGHFAVAWVSDEQDGNMQGIFAQRFDASGTALGDEFQVNTYTTDTQRRPTIAMDHQGNFVVTWDSVGQDGSGKGIYGQRYDAAGIPQGGEFRINTFTANEQAYNWVTMSPKGDFVVVWGSEGQDGNGFGIYGQRFDAEGQAQGGEFQINTYTTSDQNFPIAAMDPNGNFVVVWDSADQDGSKKGIFGQRFNAAGIPQGKEFQANTFTKNDQTHPIAAMAQDGSFIVAWISFEQAGRFEGIFGKRFDANGNSLRAP